MSNHWGRRPDFKVPPLVIGIVVIGIIGFALFPNFFTNTLANSTSTLANSNSVNLPDTDDSTNLNSVANPNQISPNSQNSSISNGNGNNEIATGYWILFADNSTLQQLSISSQDYAFLQSLVNSDTKGTPTTPIFLVENGQIQKYVVSNEINSVVSNLATIYKRSSTTGQTPVNPNTTIPDTSNSGSSNSSTSNSGTSSSGTSSSGTSNSGTSNSGTSNSGTSSSGTSNSSTSTPDTTIPNTTTPNS